MRVGKNTSRPASVRAQRVRAAGRFAVVTLPLGTLFAGSFAALGKMPLRAVGPSPVFAVRAAPSPAARLSSRFPVTLPLGAWPLPLPFVSAWSLGPFGPSARPRSSPSVAMRLWVALRFKAWPWSPSAPCTGAPGSPPSERPSSPRWSADPEDRRCPPSPGA